jgi:hypothetical protein
MSGRPPIEFIRGSTTSGDPSYHVFRVHADQLPSQLAGSVSDRCLFSNGNNPSKFCAIVWNPLASSLWSYLTKTLRERLHHNERLLNADGLGSSLLSIASTFGVRRSIAPYEEGTGHTTDSGSVCLTGQFGGTYVRADTLVPLARQPLRVPAERSYAPDMVTTRYYNEKTSIFWNLIKAGFNGPLFFSQKCKCVPTFRGLYYVQYSFFRSASVKPPLLLCAAVSRQQMNKPKKKK